MDNSLATPSALADQKNIVCQIFSTMAGIDLAPCDVHLPGVEDQVITSQLTYSRASEGAMLIECTPRLAFAFTARLFSIQAPTAPDPDVFDAMGELVNMVGGNLKGLMPEQTRISAPSMLQPAERDALLATSRRLSRLCFEAGMQHCCVSLLEPL